MTGKPERLEEAGAWEGRGRLGGAAEAYSLEAWIERSHPGCEVVDTAEIVMTYYNPFFGVDPSSDARWNP